MMERCEVCGNRCEKRFRVILADRSSHGVDRGGVVFCCDHCARAASSDAVDEASIESSPASDPPTFSPSARAADDRPRLPQRAQRLQEGKIG